MICSHIFKCKNVRHSHDFMFTKISPQIQTIIFFYIQIYPQIQTKNSPQIAYQNLSPLTDSPSPLKSQPPFVAVYYPFHRRLCLHHGIAICCPCRRHLLPLPLSITAQSSSSRNDFRFVALIFGCVRSYIYFSFNLCSLCRRPRARINSSFSNGYISFHVCA